MRRSLRLLVPLLVLLLAGCAGQPTRPQREGALMVLTLSSTSGDPGHPITARVVLTNIGREPVSLMLSCTGPGFGPVVRAPDLKNVVDACAECPNAVCPVCAPYARVIEPSQSAERTFTYAGTLYTCDGPYEGPAGTYTVEAHAQYTMAGGRVETVASAATFTWSTTVPR